MKVSDYNYHLPPELIAQYPAQKRTDSRLLKVSAGGALVDGVIPDLYDSLAPGDLLVLNNTKVIPARLFGQKQTGGKVEVLVERVLDDQHLIAQVRASKAPKPEQVLFIDGDVSAPLRVLGREDAFFKLQTSQTGSLLDWLERVGHIPLPPYIERSDEHGDYARYQTVFAQHQGAVAAPTAGLHYDQLLLDKLQAKGVQLAYVTLHVGAGTYQPMHVDNVLEHKMHSEWVEVTAEVCETILHTKQEGHRVVAVGTTVVRSLETAAQHAQSQLIDGIIKAEKEEGYQLLL